MGVGQVRRYRFVVLCRAGVVADGSYCMSVGVVELDDVVALAKSIGESHRNLDTLKDSVANLLRLKLIHE